MYILTRDRKHICGEEYNRRFFGISHERVCMGQKIGRDNELCQYLLWGLGKEQRVNKLLITANI